MSIRAQIGIVQRVLVIVTTLQKEYAENKLAALELIKLAESLEQLEKFLTQLDALKPNHDTNTIRQFVESINLHLDILKNELQPKDYRRLANKIKAMKTILNFHPYKYSFLTFIVAWIIEFIYFI